MDDQKPRLTGREALLGEMLGDSLRLVERQEQASARLEAAAAYQLDLLQQMTAKADQIATASIQAAQESAPPTPNLAELVRQELGPLKQQLDELCNERGNVKTPTDQRSLVWLVVATACAALAGGLIAASMIRIMGS